jgi:3-methylfumaryl-CoA hydratase
MHNGESTLAQYVESWTPAPMTDDDPMLPGPVAAMSALLNQPESVATAGDPLPPLWHWFHFLQWPRQDELGGDGHPRHGCFLPPIPDRQRMFAGGRCEIVEPLRLGERAERISSLGNVAVKHGKTGELLFVTQRNEFRQRGHTCLIEDLDLVYRCGRGSAQHPDTLDTSATAQVDEPWQLALQSDPTLLFRFSALTANAHRIHYDTPYVQEEEGYPGLVVHGPLLAVLMLELVRGNTSRPVRSLSFRLRSPVFVGEHLVGCGTPSAAGANMRVATHREARHATAEVTFA